MAKKAKRSFGSKARRLGASAAGGWQGSAKALGTGGGLALVHNYAASKVDALNERPWLAPVLIAVAGHFGKRKFPTAGVALIGAAGYAGGQAIAMMRARKAAEETAPPAPAQTQGLVNPADFTRGVIAPADFLPSSFGGAKTAASISSAMSL